MRELLAAFIRDSNAFTAIEYGLIMGTISVAMLVGLQALGDALTGHVITISSSLNN